MPCEELVLYSVRTSRESVKRVNWGQLEDGAIWLELCRGAASPRAGG